MCHSDPAAPKGKAPDFNFWGLKIYWDYRERKEK